MWKVLALCLSVCVRARAYTQVDMWTMIVQGLYCFTCEFKPVCVCMFPYDAQARVRGKCMRVIGVTGTRLMRL